MRDLNQAVVKLVPNSSFGFGALAWSASGVASKADKTVKGRKMKALANTAALLVTLSIMGGLLFAQRDYQNSWHEPAVHQSESSATHAAAAARTGEFKVVMK